MALTITGEPKQNAHVDQLKAQVQALEGQLKTAQLLLEEAQKAAQEASAHDQQQQQQQEQQVAAALEAQKSAKAKK